MQIPGAACFRLTARLVKTTEIIDHTCENSRINAIGDRLSRDRILTPKLRKFHLPEATRPQPPSTRARDARFRHRLRACVTACVGAVVLSACYSFLPTVGPTRDAIERAKATREAVSIQIFDIDETVTRRLLARRASRTFSETLGSQPTGPHTVGPGDALEVSIWEAAPATLFGSQLSGFTGLANTFGSEGIPTSHATTLPEQTVDEEGKIFIPFAGRITAAGRTLQAIQEDIAVRLAKKANQPEVLVRLTKNMSANATLVGEISINSRVSLLPGNERLLDALAAAGGVRQPVNKTTIQITRDSNVYSMPLETIIRDPHQNVSLLPGDVVTALFQPYSFIALGATGKTDEINFETQGITLAQALARSGGLIDTRSNAKGVFIFRFEPQDALDWPRQPVKTTLNGLVPTVFRIDLSDPRSFFLIQSFPVENRDVLYVSNAPINEIEKFLNVLFTVAYPVLTAVQAGAL
jgi:polysaccharide export outer membrane protein